jgi:hypothetical protein
LQVYRWKMRLESRRHLEGCAGEEQVGCLENI